MPTIQTIGPLDPPPVTWRTRLAALKVELVVLAGFALWILACWPSRVFALGGPAVVIIWYALPSRPPFVLARKDDGA